MKLADGTVEQVTSDVNDRLPLLPQQGEELATLPGAETGSALRVNQPDADGNVRLEHLAYSSALGWYVQKTFTIPASLLSSLATELRKADCLLPRRPVTPAVPLRLVGTETLERRRA